MLDPKSFTDTLQKKYNFKLKGTSPIDFHLGQSFSWNDDGEMGISAKCYVDKMIDTYVQLYGEKPRKASSPREAVASKYVMIFHLPGKYNPADILSKH
jgi:hypothetical protein